MQHLHNNYLYEMGITPWQLRQGDMIQQQAQPPIASFMPDLTNVALLVVRPESMPASTLFHSILKAMHLQPNQCQSLTVEQFEQLTCPLPKLLWAIDCQLPELPGHHVITSPSLSALANDGAAKKHLWQQICQQSKL
ncbi:DNA polymerase III subunit psi [Motilimonas pumila]|nr:DNA polymerase III subunit psi [Motilimonas pumila]